MVRSCCLILTAVMFLACPSTGWAQEKKEPTDLSGTIKSFSVNLLDLSNKDLHKELKVTPEQAKKLNSFHQQRGFRANVDERKKELSTILKADQLKRLEEIALQQFVKSNFFKFMANRNSLPFFEKNFKLTKQQIQKLANGEDFVKTLTKDQSKVWQKLSGKPFVANLQVAPGGFGGRGGFVGRPTVPTLQFLQSEDVRTDLKFTVEQKKKYDTIVEGYDKGYQSLRDPANRKLPIQVQRDMSTELANSTDAALVHLFSDAQKTRLAQLKAQQWMQSRKPWDIFDYADTKSLLNLSDKQQEQLAKIRQDGKDTLKKIFLSGQKYEQIAKMVTENNKATYDKAMNSITEQQRKDLKKVTGEPFRGNFSRSSPFGGFRGGLGTRSYLGRYSASTRITQNLPTALKDIKQTDEQKTSGIFTDKQTQRLKQLYLQIREHVSGPLHIFVFKDVSEKLNLTKDQIAKLEPLVSKNYTNTRTIRLNKKVIPEKERQEQLKQLAKILTDKQQKQFAMVKGKAVADVKALVKDYFKDRNTGGFRGTTGSGRLGRYSASTRITQNLPTALKDIKQTDEQKTSGTFTDEQTQRLKQLYMQLHEHYSGPFFVFIFKDVTIPLKLTKEQQAKLEPLVGKAFSDYSARRTTNTGISDKERQEQLKQLAKILSEKQLKQYQKIKGKAVADVKALVKDYVKSRGTRTTRTSVSTVNPRLRYLTNDLLAKHLQLTPKQTEELKSLNQTWIDEMNKLGGRTAEKAKVDALRTKVDKSIEKILSPKQWTRFGQIELQANLLARERTKTQYLVKGSVSEQFNLSDKQVNTLNSLFADSNKILDLLDRETNYRSRIGGNSDRQLRSEILKDLTKNIDNRAMAVLTKEQQQQWHSMFGEPFEQLSVLIRSRFSVPGGFGVPGGRFGGPGVAPKKANP